MTPDEDGNYNAEIVKVEYNGNIYPISWVEEKSKEIKSRYNAPRPLSLGVLAFSWEVDEDAKSIYKFDDYRLSFGEFSPTENYKEETFKLLWSDGTNNIFKFDCYIDWAKKNKPVVHNDIYMDGQKLKDWQVEFYK